MSSFLGVTDRPNLTGGDIKAAYEAQPDTNEFSDAEKQKLKRVAGSIDGMALIDDLSDGQNCVVLGSGEIFTYDAASTLIADGALVVDAVGMGAGRLISTRTRFGTVSDMLADVRTGFPNGTEFTVAGFRYEVQPAPYALGLTTEGGVKLKVLTGEKGYNVIAFGADLSGATYSNDPVRKAFAAVENAGGGQVYFPAGQYSFFREVDPNQPPATTTFNQRACFVAGDNTKVTGDGRDATVLTFECPGQAAGAVDDTQFYQFIAHGRGFEMSGITVQGDVSEAEFEFVSYWGSVNIPSIITHASRDGDVYCADSKVTNCRLGGLRGMCYGTSIIRGVEFTNNDVFLSNGVNTSGADVKVNNNHFYRSEVIESAGTGKANAAAVAAGFTEYANIEFCYNTCIDCSGGALGGNTSADPLAKTRGYALIGNKIFNYSAAVTSAMTIANNALDVIIADNIIRGKYTTAALNVTNSGLTGRSPGNVHVISGYYETIDSGGGSPRALGVKVSENEVFIHGGTFKSDGTNAILLSSDSPATIHLINADLIAQYGYGFGTGHTAEFRVSEGINWTPTTSNVNTIASGMAALSNSVIKPVLNRFFTVDETDADQIVEQFRRNGGAQTDDRFCHFLRYGTGRMGWGDATAVSVFPDVYLERKAENTLGLDAGDAFRCGTTTTAARPSAATVGEGSQMWDTTLKQPIWSDGTQWVDAAGTAV